MLSICGHLISGLFLYYGLPTNTPTAPEHHVIVLDMVKVSDLTNIAASHKAKKKADEKKYPTKQAVKEVKASEAAKPAAQENEATAAAAVRPTAEAMPLPVAAKPKEQAQPKAKQAQEEAAPIKTQPKQEKKKPLKKSDPFADASFLKTLEEVSKKSAQQEAEEKELRETLSDLEADSTLPFNSDIPISVTEMDAIRSQIQQVWNTSSFSGAESAVMQVKVEIALDTEGNVLSVRPMLQRSQSPQYKAFVDSAVRSVRIASPLKDLPPEKHNSWKLIELAFDSSGLIQ
jgi:hypothetical protein